MRSAEVPPIEGYMPPGCPGVPHQPADGWGLWPFTASALHPHPHSRLGPDPWGLDPGPRGRAYIPFGLWLPLPPLVWIQTPGVRRKPRVAFHFGATLYRGAGLWAPLTVLAFVGTRGLEPRPRGPTCTPEGPGRSPALAPCERARRPGGSLPTAPRFLPPSSPPFRSVVVR